MRTSAKASLVALALALAAGAAVSQDRQDAPESILPPGFDDPVQPAPAPTSAPGSAAPPPSVTAPPVSGVAPAAPTPTPTPTATPEPIDLSAYELPASARRSLADAGAIGADSGGLPPGAFGTSSGVTLERLMRRLNAPLPSRWLSIALRRALVSRVDVPSGVNGADFAAERAWLLVRMGEADMARAVVQSVDVDQATPKLLQVGMQAMLAAGDPAGLCPLVEPASAVSGEAAWPFARAMCAALGGQPAEAGRLFTAARRQSGRGIDASLAEKVVGAGAGGRRAVTIVWDGVDRLTAWRFGLATATGVEIPEQLYGTVGAHVAGWTATSPMRDPLTRARYADVAASLGVLSSAALADLYAEIEANDDSSSAPGAVARDLRAAVVERGAKDRVRMLRQLWDEPAGAAAKYARLVMTARAAARVTPSADHADDSPRLIAAMLSAGLDVAATRWSGVVPAASDGWAMLALAGPIARTASYGEVDAYQDRDSDPQRLKARMLLAGLAGLGRLPVSDAEQLARSLDVRLGAENSWTRAIAAAARRNEPGTVLLLTAVGMQTANWRGVPPEVLFHATAALRATGLEGVARMVAAEAIARL